MVEATDPAFSIGMVVCTILLGVTAYSIYLSFGPPASELSDPFEDHED